MKPVCIPQRLRLGIALLIFALLGTHARAIAVGQPHEIIPPYTAELDARLNGPPEPFVAVYREGDRVVAFVAAKHVFTARNPTLDAIDRAFEAADPALMILEGFPTTMGMTPAPLVATARRRGTAEADDFANGEAMYAATLALARGVPFLGGEPTRRELATALVAQGYRPESILFVQLVGVLKQELRSGSLAGPSDARLQDTYESWSRDLAKDFGLLPLGFDAFRARYRQTYGLELEADARLADRPDGGTPDDPTAALQQAAGVLRDRHLLGVIEDGVARHERVVVVYGSNHWVTLAAALERRYGQPVITRF